MKYIILRLFTLIRYPFTLFYFKKWKGTIIYPKCHFKNIKFMRITNSVICRYSDIRAYNTVNEKKQILIDIEHSHICDRAYISSGGGLKIFHARFAPNIFISTFRHKLAPSENDSHYNIVIDYPLFIGQNVSIIGNVHVGNYSVIGAASVVTKDVHKMTMVVGNPAKTIKRFNETKKVWEELV